MEIVLLNLMLNLKSLIENVSFFSLKYISLYSFQDLVLKI